MIRASMKAAANALMRCLTASGFRVQHFAYFENWRRAPGCTCAGCENWHLIERGETTVEEIGQEALQCVNRFLAWEDKAVTGESWNYTKLSLAAASGIAALLHPLGFGIFAIVTTVGKNDILSQYFKGSAYTATWYLGLVDGGTTPTYAVGDTMASHAGWTENVGYSNANRVTWVGGTAAGGSVDNTASAASFNINATGTIAGQFMVNNSTKSGTTGVLYSEASFTQGNRSVLSGDTLNCTATQTVS